MRRRYNNNNNGLNGTFNFKLLPKEKLPDENRIVTGATGPTGIKGQDFYNQGSGYTGVTGVTGPTGPKGSRGLYMIDGSGNIPLSNDLIPSSTIECNCDCENVLSQTNLGAPESYFHHMYSNEVIFGPIDLSFGGNIVFPVIYDSSNGLFINLGSPEHYFHQIHTDKLFVNTIFIPDTSSSNVMKINFDLSNQQIIHSVQSMNGDFQIYRVGVKENYPIIESKLMPFTGLSFYGILPIDEIDFEQISRNIMFPLLFTHLTDFCNYLSGFYFKVATDGTIPFFPSVNSVPTDNGSGNYVIEILFDIPGQSIDVHAGEIFILSSFPSINYPGGITFHWTYVPRNIDNLIQNGMVDSSITTSKLADSSITSLRLQPRVINSQTFSPYTSLNPNLFAEATLTSSNFLCVSNKNYV